MKEQDNASFDINFGLPESECILEENEFLTRQILAVAVRILLSILVAAAGGWFLQNDCCV
jgi:hypothetical protein